ncbi:DNA-binding transcriptional LysR family regulator [Herbihabitans rhizosphaerae]|uniref:DNA-binding transcriptional LysR family regulator n=1 Tax=Herbihabitans rhizosphaerae TaxID=1872711 RepID=A0A4Q7KP57_9PSEU|nr:LysR family transcriptional regulator [Herbihabitans rhizosphaerae]RZS37032.1 DNA-binding transcriptional LysR family regulator [Herbihabitans rhizosphaerae]
MIDHRLHTLRVLRAEETVTAAANALHLSPSAVSQQMRQLSSELGVRLLDPVGRGVQLTPAALALIRHADLLAAQWEKTRAALDGYRDGTAGHLRVTGISTALAEIVAPAIENLERRYPEMTFQVSEDPNDDHFQLLLTDRTDIVIAILAPDSPHSSDGRFAQRLLFDEPQDLLVGENHSFAGRPSVHLTEAAEENWIQAGDPRDQHQLLLTAAAIAGFTPRITHRASDWFAVGGLVAHGHGICLIPRLAPVAGDLPVRRIPLAGEWIPRRHLIVCVRRGSEDQVLIARGLDALGEVADRLRPR